ncbi:hypothetical protein Mp_6g06000 [Marchantia polymorpha subsp. ruderalis]|uniref:Uncharacterized protein n=2 Tax=Marchantia polymorpha TaxID=3197 RepID=A0AAF6BP16_MARPO|nr:hypothetical protein MARPO_0097s0044 [Marchantia polymorpha]BBN13750.1 hypothetical protein Mp_6g06000 [Marchantia polymorpha subsp. ruderalis]|eukprot:PTQ32562.1 hypothetical protein MARPO_0097s0044 [Marchantia polymorpha]
MIGHDVQAFRQPRARIPTYSRMEFVSHVIDRCTGSGENHLMMTVAPWISGALEMVVDSHHSPNFLETRFFLPFSSVKVGTRLGRSNNGHLLTIKAFLSTEGWHQRSGQSELFAICCESHSMSGKREYDTGLYSTFHVLKVAGGSGGIVAYRSQELVVEKLVFWWRMST